LSAAREALRGPMKRAFDEHRAATLEVLKLSEQESHREESRLLPPLKRLRDQLGVPPARHRVPWATPRRCARSSSRRKVRALFNAMAQRDLTVKSAATLTSSAR